MAVKISGGKVIMDGTLKSVADWILTLSTNYDDNHRICNLTLRATTGNTGDILVGTSDLDSSSGVGCLAYLDSADALTIEFSTGWVQADQLFITGTTGDSVWIWAAEY